MWSSHSPRPGRPPRDCREQVSRPLPSRVRPACRGWRPAAHSRWSWHRGTMHVAPGLPRSRASAEPVSRAGRCTPPARLSPGPCCRRPASPGAGRSRLRSRWPGALRPGHGPLSAVLRGRSQCQPCRVRCRPVRCDPDRRSGWCHRLRAGARLPAGLRRAGRRPDRVRAFSWHQSTRLTQSLAARARSALLRCRATASATGVSSAARPRTDR